MDMQKTNNEMIAEPTAQARKADKSIAHRIFNTNWGLAVIGGLVALGIGVSMLHGGYVESHAEEIPEVETVAVLPIS